MTNSPEPSPDIGLSIGIPPQGAAAPITARKAGEMADLELDISPRTQPVPLALRNLAKAINIALRDDYLDTELDRVYKAARVKLGAVQVLHKQYIGLGDGVFASLGKAAKSVQLSLRGADAGSPDGERWIEEHGSSMVGGLFSLLGRKMNLLQEYEDKVPVYVEQTLDRLEAKKIIGKWQRNEWKIETTLVGLDIIITPLLTDAPLSADF